MSSRAPQRRKPDEPGPAEVGDPVRVERPGDAEDMLGIVREVRTYDEYDAPDRLVIRTSTTEPSINTAREHVEVVTGVHADLVRDIVGGDEDA